jgi:hypothetical protein
LHVVISPSRLLSCQRTARRKTVSSGKADQRLDIIEAQLLARSVQVRVGDLPPPGECLRLEHLRLLKLFPVWHSDQHVVQAQLEDTIQPIGHTPTRLQQNQREQKNLQYQVFNSPDCDCNRLAAARIENRFPKPSAARGL